jgi:tRNA(Ile)-lysidine synthetase-like protein
MSRIIPLNKIPKEIGIALSGGIDSMAILNYLLLKKHNVTIVHYVHDSSNASEELDFVSRVAADLELPIVIGKFSSSNNSTSKEANWRSQRYEFFTSLQMPIVTGHTLDDAVETYLFTCFNGLGKIMPYKHANVIRPFLLTTKNQLIDHATENKVSFYTDITNLNVDFAARNRIRHSILPEVLKINPGLYKIIKKRIVEKHLIKNI